MFELLGRGFTVVQAVVAVGGNVGDVRQTLRRAQTLVEQDGSVQNLRSAELFRSVAMGADAGDSFINSAWVFETSLEPLGLLDLLQRVENELGRTREVRWGPRTLDLDLIFYGDEVIDLPRLVVPHPHCWYRQFVLAPVVSLLPDSVHPSFGRTMRELSERLEAKPFVLGVGGEPADDSSLAKVARQFPSVDVQRQNSRNDDELGEVSLAVWFGNEESQPKNPLWLRIAPEIEHQFLQDALTAASTDVEPV
jgi:2-amino-4-hydroxy-6-hydroxymethyldihydropteridine diphosphokinase